MASNHITYAMTITMFIVFFTMTIVSGGFTNYVSNSTLNQYNVNQQDLKINPDIPKIQNINVDIENEIYEKQNVKVVNTENYFNGSQDYNTEKSIVLKNNSSTGYVSYNIPRSESINTKTQKTSILLNTRTHLWEGNITNGCANSNKCTPIRAESSTPVSQNNSIITIEFDKDTGILSSPEPVLYDINGANEEAQGFFSQVVSYLSAAASSLASWTSIITGLPGNLLWIGILFGIMSLIIVIEILSW